MAASSWFEDEMAALFLVSSAYEPVLQEPADATWRKPSSMPSEPSSFSSSLSESGKFSRAAPPELLHSIPFFDAA